MQVSDAKDGCALPTRQFKELINRPVTTTDNDMMGTESETESSKKSSRLTSNEKCRHKALKIIIIFFILVRKETKAFLHKLSTEAQDCFRTYILKTVKYKVTKTLSYMYIILYMYKACIMHCYCRLIMDMMYPGSQS